MTLGPLLLIVAALGFRGGAAALRTGHAHPALRPLGWLLTAFAAWFAAAAAGAWAPLWPVLLAAAVLALLDRLRRSLALWVAADALLVAGLGLLSIPMLGPTRIVLAALVMVGAGLALDLTLGRLPAPLHRAARWATAPAVVGVGAFLALALAPPGSQSGPNSLRAAVSLNSGIMAAAIPDTQRITLATGAVAWLDRPRGQGPFPAALFFHGAHPDASHQPTALAARRALVNAGYAVLAVDHPGYGESPHAPLEAGVAAWDPLPTDLAAYESLRAMPAVRGITAIGHSMGNADVLRLLVAGVPIDAAVMMGAALPYPDADPEYWYGRFLRDQGIAAPLDRETVREIRALYHDDGRYARELPPSHPPVYFVKFGIEWRDVAATRDALYDLLPGPKTALRLERTHYLDTKGVHGMVIGDTNAARDLEVILKNTEQQLASDRATTAHVRH